MRMSFLAGCLLPLTLLSYQQFAYAGAEKKIAPGAVSKYTKKSYPKLYQKWGDKGVARLNNALPLAALKAAKSPECDRVEVVDVSDQRSQPPTQAVFFVDCANGKRFYMTMAELEKNAPAESELSKAARITDASLISSCEREIKPQLARPSTYNRRLTDTSVYRPASGRSVVTYSLTGKNALGETMQLKARCTFAGDKMTSAELTADDAK